MELPAEVMIHNPILGLKGHRGVLLQVGGEGYYEVNCAFGEQLHRTLLPIQGTVLIHRHPEPVVEGADVEIER